MKKLEPIEWTRLWRQKDNPMITSFGAMFQNSYDHDIRDFWHQQLDVDCKHIVDLACGNGALVWIADEIRNNSSKKTQITGVDIANIKPFKILRKKAKRHPMIKFIGNTSIDDLPFDDGSIDIVISQYGLEYSNLDTTIPEISRVLTANGKMCFVIHDENSAIIQKEKLVIAECLRVLKQEKIEQDYLELDESYNAYTGIDAANDPKLKEQKEKISVAAASILQHAKKAPGEIFQIENYVTAMQREFLDSAPVRSTLRRDRIHAAHAGLKSYVSRLGDLIGAALTAEDLQQLIARIEKQGFRIVENKKMKYQVWDNVGAILVACRTDKS